MRRLPLIVLLLLTLSACGYHLRAALQLPEAMQATLLSGVGANAPLRDEIAAALASSEARLVTRRGEAGAELQILNETMRKRATAVDVGGVTSEYELNYRLEFALRHADGQPWLAPQTLNLRRRYAFDSAQVLGKSREEVVLRREMRREAVRMMFARLYAGLQQGARP